MKRFAAYLLCLALLSCLAACASPAAGQTGLTLHRDASSQKQLLSQVAAQSSTPVGQPSDFGESAELLQDRYPSAESHLRVCHGSWQKGSWDELDDKMRVSGAFMIGTNTYINGVGMYLTNSAFRSSAVGAIASSYVTYRLNGAYDTLSFDLGPDSSDMRYCGSDDGEVCVQIYSDDTLVYDTGYFDYSLWFPDQEVDIAGAQKLKIVLSVSRGKNNTLNVVFADAALS